MDNAVGYGCWHVARCLVARGARVDKLWHAAALGLMSRVEKLVAADPGPDTRRDLLAGWLREHGARPGD